MTQNDNTPRIYVACLASYNAGELHGEWVDLDSDKDVMGKAIASMLASSAKPNAEEWAIRDHENMPSGISEYHSLDELAELGALWEEYGDAAWAALENCYKLDIDAARNALEEGYSTHDNDKDFAYSMAEDMGLLQDNGQWPYTCIDWELAAHELMYDYFATEWNGTSYYFRRL